MSRGRFVPSLAPTSGRPLGAVAMIVVTAFGVTAIGVTACGSDEEVFAVEAAETSDASYRFVIPAGSGARIDEGEALDLLPAEMQVEVGEVLEIVNDDDRGHLVGPFYVGAGETLRQRFASPGHYIGVCSVHSGGEIVITVT